MICYLRKRRILIETIHQQPLLALDEVPAGGFWRRVSDSIALWFEDF